MYSDTNTNCIPLSKCLHTGFRGGTGNLGGRSAGAGSFRVFFFSFELVSFQLLSRIFTSFLSTPFTSFQTKMFAGEGWRQTEE